VAALTTAGAVALLFVAFLRISSTRVAVFGALVFALGTGTWSVASQALWQHGPAMLFIALALLHPAPKYAGFAWIPAVLTRPISASIGLASSAYEIVRKRRVEYAVVPLASILLGSALFLLYNRWAFGSWSPFAAYGFNPVLTGLDVDLISWLRNVGSALVDPRRGILTISPFLVILLPGLARAWRNSPRWVRGAAMGGVAYLLVHYKFHDFAGGHFFFGYRYPLEGLLALAPLLLLSHQAWVAMTRYRSTLFWIAVVVAVALQAIGVANPYSF
jgi:hypothetical protein